MNETPNDMDAETLRLVAALLEANERTLEGLRVEVTPATGTGSKSWRKGYMTAKLRAETGLWGLCNALGIRQMSEVEVEAKSADEARIGLRNRVVMWLEARAENACHDARKSRAQAQELLDEAEAHEAVATKIGTALMPPVKAA